MVTLALVGSALAASPDAWIVRADALTPGTLPAGCTVERSDAHARWHKVSCESTTDLASKIAKKAILVERDVPVAIQLHGGPDVPSSHWQHSNTGQRVGNTNGLAGADIGSLDAWKTSTGWSGTRLAIVDTGFHLDHDDLKGRSAAKGSRLAVSCDVDGHGTAVAGAALANGLDGSGATGLAYEYGEFLPVHFGGGDCQITGSDLVFAIQEVLDAKVDVANFSFSFDTDIASVHAAFDELDAANVVIVLSAGNDGKALSSMKARFPIDYDLEHAIVVGSSNASDQLAAHSNYGPEVDLVAPGERIATSDPDGGASSWTGTSFAAPLVAAAAAMIRDQWPDLDAEKTINAILDGAAPIGISCAETDVCVSKGARLDVNGAFARAEELSSRQGVFGRPGADDEAADGDAGGDAGSGNGSGLAGAAGLPFAGWACNSTGGAPTGAAALLALLAMARRRR